LIVGLERCQAVDEIAHHLVGRGVAQARDRIERVESGPQVFGVHALLGLVHDDDGPNLSQRLPVGKSVRRVVAIAAIDDVVVCAEGMRRHHHDL